MVCLGGPGGAVEAQSERLKALYDKMMDDFSSYGFDLKAIQAIRYRKFRGPTSGMKGSSSPPPPSSLPYLIQFSEKDIGMRFLSLIAYSLGQNAPCVIAH